MVAPCAQREAPVLAGIMGQDDVSTGQFDFSFATTNASTTEVRFASKETGGALLFVGAPHTTGPEPELFGYFEKLFSTEKPTEIYIEVADTSYIDALPTSQDEVIRTRGEPSYLGYIARANSIPVLPLEPQPSRLTEQLGRIHSPNRVALAYILRDVQIMRDRRKLFGEGLENIASRAIEDQQRLAEKQGTISVTNILTLTQAVNRLWPGLDWRQVPAEWFNPLRSSDGTGSIYINTLFAEEMALRDDYALHLLLSRVAAGKRVIALAGRTHAENHLVALSCMMQGL